MKFKSDIEVQAGLKDSSGALGTSGQILSSTNGNVSWVTPTVNTVARDVQNEVKAGVAINKGQAVYVTGADGTNIIVGLASNTSEATSSKTLGLLNATVAVNGFADVVQIGRLSGLNTIGAVVGDPVWLGTNGNLIYGLTNKPYAPAHLVFIGVVTRVNANNGEIFITVQNGFELKEIHDVDIITNVPINGDVLGYDGTLWVNKTIAEWLGFTPANASGTTNYVSKFTGANSLGDSQIFDNGTNVGIGTNLPQATLQVGNGTGVKSIYVTGSGTNLGLGGLSVSFLGFATGTISTVNTSGAVPLGVGTRSTQPLILGTNNAERMRIDSSGNVGIGTTSPAKKLDVNGDALINSLTIGRGSGSVSTNTVFGYQALNSNTSSTDIISIGYRSLYSLVNNTNNIAIGNTALYTNYGGTYNLAIGHQSLYSLTLGNYNTAIGNQSLYLTTTGSGNVAIGLGTLVNNTTGNFNTAVGANALNEHIASGNTAVGYLALAGAPGSSGGNNVAVGANSLSSNQTGSSNIAIGWYALNLNTTGANNVAIGDGSLLSVTYSNSNVAIGGGSLGNLLDGDSNTCIGSASGGMSTSSVGMTLIGYDLKYKPSTLNTPLSNNELAISQYWSESPGRPHFYAPDKIFIDASTNTEILSVSSDAYNAFFIDYSFDDASGNLRAGTIKCIFTSSGGFQYQLDDQATNSIGTTADLTFDVIDDGSHNAVLRVVNVGGASSYIRFTSRLLFKTI